MVENVVVVKKKVESIIFFIIKVVYGVGLGIGIVFVNGYFENIV